MVDPVVRLATRDDVVQLAELERESRAALVTQRGGARWLESHPERGGEWSTYVDQGVVHAAVIDAAVVGYLVTRRDGRVAAVDEVYVTPGAREVGFGDGLLAQAMTDAREAGCELIEGEALPGDRETKNLYERAGITARLIVVSRAL
jgi:GNAT superfamily N-acetyltransferase